MKFFVEVFDTNFSFVILHKLATFRYQTVFNSTRHKNTGLVSSGVILISWEEGASLALVGYPSSDGIMIKIPCGVDVLLR